MTKVPLFEKRIGVNIFFTLPSGVYGLPWPFARLQLFKDYLIIKDSIRSFRLNYSDIDIVRHWWWQIGIGIYHHSSNVGKNVRIYGILSGQILFKQLKEAIKKNNLKITTN